MRLCHRWSVFLVAVGAFVALAVPALAEFDSTKQTDWGVATKGASNTIARWEALAWDVDQIGGTVYVGGNFLDVTDGDDLYPQAYLAAFDARTGAWQSWFAPEVENAVFALEPTPDGGLMVGGEIGDWNGQTIGALVKIDPASGELWPGWATRAYGGSSVIRDLRLEPDGWMYAVGDFTTVTQGNGPVPAGGAMRFDPVTGTIDTNWLPMLENGAGWGVGQSPTTGTTYIAGFFQSVDGNTAARGLVGLDAGGIIVADRSAVPYNGCTSWAYCSQLYDVLVTEYGHIWVGGVEHALYVIDESSGDLVTMHYTACDPTVNEVCLPRDWFGGEFQELERIGDRVYATCHCWYDIYSDESVIHHTRPSDNPNATHDTVKAVAAFSAETGALIPSFKPELTGDAGGFAVHRDPSDGCLWVAGGFSSYGAPGGPQPAAFDVVRLCDQTGPGPAAQPAAIPPPPEDCVVSPGTDPADGSPTATVSWTNVSSSIGTIVYRSVDGQGTYWRGRVDPPAAPQFTEGVPGAGVTDYFVEHAYPGGQRSELVSCGRVDNLPDLAPPAWCETAVGPDDRAVLAWDPGTDVESYIVRRSVDGGTFYWRGRVTGTDFTGAVLDPGRTYDYTVEGRSADGSVTDSVPCTPQLFIEAPELSPPGACAAVIDAENRAVLAWDPGTGAESYIVRRSVDGGTFYWRGRVTGTDFTGAVLDPGRTYDYTVEGRGADGSVTDSVPCTPPLFIEAPELAAVTACDALLVGAANATPELRWEQASGAERYIVRRSVDGGTFYWRASVSGTRADEGSLVFDDQDLTDQRSYAYTVTSVGLDGSTSTPAPCAPALTYAPPPLSPLTSCSAAVSAPDASGAVTIGVAWDATGDPSLDVVIYRSRDGGPFSWRGRIGNEAGPFVDSGNVAHLYAYEALAIAPDGRRSERTACSTTEQPA